MNKTNSTLTKTCSSCGIQKPLSAFLQLSDKDSGTYGAVCSSCRQANRDKATTVIDVEDGTRTTTTATIDTKSKVQAELDQKQQRQQTEEDYHADRDKDELIETDRTKKIDTSSKDQRKHREGLLGRRSFLSAENKTAASKSPIERAAQTAAQEAHNVDQVSKQETSTKEDLKEKDIDLSAPVEDTRFGKKEKHKGTSFQHFSYAQSQVIGRSFTDTQQKPPTTEPTKDTPSEFIEKNWGPGSKRR